MPAVVPMDLLTALAAEAPAGIQRHARNGRHQNGPPFDIDTFIERNGLEVDGPDPYQGGRRWTFTHSSMCEHHGDGPFLIQFENGGLSAGCHHNGCSWGWPQLRARFERRGPLHVNNSSSNALPEVLLPSGDQTISATGTSLGELLAAQHNIFLRGGVVTRVLDNHNLEPVRPSEMASDFEQVAQLTKRVVIGTNLSTVPVTCDERSAKLIMSAQGFKSALPALHFISPCPVLLERDGQLVVITGYDRHSGILAHGDLPPEVQLSDAVALLRDLLLEFRFVSPSDQSRAIASMITPSLTASDLLDGRAPNDLTEADQSQAGKGFRNKLTAAIYRQKPAVVNQHRGGIGSIEEAFDKALIEGKTFIALDNIRGKIDSPKIESFLTEDSYNARCAYERNTRIDPRRVIVMCTCNRAELTVDLANRSNIVRILKQPAGYTYRRHPEGDLLGHVRANQPLYLGAIFAIIRAWHAAGKPRTTETRHDFSAWAQVLDWIVINLCGAQPLLDGHREVQERVSSPYLPWLRDVALAVVRQRLADCWLVASQLLDAIAVDGAVELPGLSEGSNIADESARTTVLQQIGRRMQHCFGSQNMLIIDGFTIYRETFTDDHRRERFRYWVTSASVGLPPCAL